MTVTGNAAHVSWQTGQRQPASPRPKFGAAALVRLWSDCLQAQKNEPRSHWCVYTSVLSGQSRPHSIFPKR